jgi:hypothetical protein
VPCYEVLQGLDFARNLCHTKGMKKQSTYQRNALDISYNGWENFETWNVALWLQNDEGLYNLACASGNYENFLNEIYGFLKKTPDGVSYTDPKVNVIQLNSEVFDF